MWNVIDKTILKKPKGVKYWLFPSTDVREMTEIFLECNYIVDCAPVKMIMFGAKRKG